MTTKLYQTHLNYQTSKRMQRHGRLDENELWLESKNKVTDPSELCEFWLDNYAYESSFVEEFETKMLTRGDTDDEKLRQFHWYMLFKEDPDKCLADMRDRMERGDTRDSAYLQVLEDLHHGDICKVMVCIQFHLADNPWQFFFRFPTVSGVVVCRNLRSSLHVLALEQKFLPRFTESAFSQNDECVITFLIHEMDLFDNTIRAHISCGTVPVFLRALTALSGDQLPFTICFFLQLSACSETYEHIAEPALFVTLARWMDALPSDTFDSGFSQLLCISCAFVKHEHGDVLLRPIVDKCFQILRVSSLMAFSYPFTYNGKAEKALEFLEYCTSKDRGASVRRVWHSLLCRKVTELLRGKTYIPFDLATFLCQLLQDTTSVELVVRLERAGVLSHLLEACQQYRLLEGEYESQSFVWTRVRTLLHDHWPSKVASSLDQMSDEESEEGTLELECPLTLAPCVHPVVASDGHVYERDAIVRYMASFADDDARSPLTRQPLEYHLYPLRGV